ncbi:MAG: hypothetical protein R3E01_11820 [Pirellulaceae bacterium]|nr:hypothetical protein [Planctomycetales bacterium]
MYRTVEQHISRLQSFFDPSANVFLNAGTPNQPFRSALEQLGGGETLFDGTVVDRDMALCCVSGLWLWNNYLDRSHTISQSIDTISGSFWHGIMHRREGDYGNAKYWFRHVGQHPVFSELAQQSRQLAQTHPLSDHLLPPCRDGQWDPYVFVDLCEQANRTRRPTEGDAALRPWCQATQSAEWWILFDYCYQHAT